MKINIIGRLYSCLFYEAIIQIALWFVVTFFVLAILKVDLFESMNSLRFILWTSSGVYFILSWFYGGQTLAMKAWNLKLTYPEGNRNFSYFLSRYFLASISLAFFGLGYLYIFFDKKNCYLHDKFLGSKIIYTQI
ncbi:RDD family protein [Methylophilaceae bacterium]|nr:RDD family protein [Methylophilaceae bacterium]